MIAFLTSSPCIYGAPRAILNPENGFVDNLFSCLPKHPRCLFICSSPDSPHMTDRFAQEMKACFEEAGMIFGDFQILDPRTQKDAQLLIWKSDFIILAGGHVPTQNKYFQQINLKDLLKNYQGVVLGTSATSFLLSFSMSFSPIFFVKVRLSERKNKTCFDFFRTDERNKSRGCLHTMPCKEEEDEVNRSTFGGTPKYE